MVIQPGLFGRTSLVMMMKVKVARRAMIGCSPHVGLHVSLVVFKNHPEKNDVEGSQTQL